MPIESSYRPVIGWIDSEVGALGSLDERHCYVLPGELGTITSRQPLFAESRGVGLAFVIRQLDSESGTSVQCGLITDGGELKSEFGTQGIVRHDFPFQATLQDTLTLSDNSTIIVASGRSSDGESPLVGQDRLTWKAMYRLLGRNGTAEIALRYSLANDFNSNVQVIGDESLVVASTSQSPIARDEEGRHHSVHLCRIDPRGQWDDHSVNWGVQP